MNMSAATDAVKTAIIHVGHTLGVSIKKFDRSRHGEDLRYAELHAKYRGFSMVPRNLYVDSLRLASSARDLAGDVVECGVWRGGMIAGISELLGPQRKYWLFDSFEGLPPAKPIDGAAAIEYQNNPHGEWYFDNCSAEESYARRAMALAGTPHVEFVKGWFSDTVAKAPVGRIALLRLDGDWYESTLTCLEAFYPKVVEGGIVILDDYHTWDGCARAVHDYLSSTGVVDRIQQSPSGGAYIVKSRPSPVAS